MKIVTTALLWLLSLSTINGDEECFRLSPDASIEDYLNPDLVGDEDMINDISNALDAGELVVIRNAFIPEFAEAMWETMENATRKGLWELETYAADDGFHFHHHNIYDSEKWDPLFLQARDMFYSDATKEYMHEISGRDTFADPDCSPSHYFPGDFSLPHEDMFGQRTLAFVWHLTKDWKPEWGGALVWMAERAHHRSVHPSFNTLCMFDVNSKASHFVSAVTHEAESRRYTFNGWWGATWEPEYDDEELEVWLGTPEERKLITATQAEMIEELLFDEERDQTTERHQHLLGLWEKYLEEHRPAHPTVVAEFFPGEVFEEEILEVESE